MADDHKSTTDALAIASAYIAYLEKDLKALRRSFGGVRKKEGSQAWDWYYTQSTAFVKRYITSGNPVNPRTARLSGG